MSTPQLEVLNLVGIETVLAVDVTDDYQGDVLAVVRVKDWHYALDEDDKIGFLSIGYGSCGGCDEWIDNTAEGRLAVCLSHAGNIKWFGNLAELQAFVAGAPTGEDDRYNSDHKLAWYGHADYFHEFQEKVAALVDGQELRESDG